MIFIQIFEDPRKLLLLFRRQQLRDNVSIDDCLQPIFEFKGLDTCDNLLLFG